MEEYLILKEKIKKEEIKLNIYKQRLQEICRHTNVKITRGYTEYQGYDRDYIPGIAQCLDCGLFVNEEENSKLYNKLKGTI